MNERIRELAEEAMEEKLSLEEFVVALKNEPHDFYGFRKHELEKFVELIVRECIASIENTINYTVVTDDEAVGCEYAITDLMNRFGVNK